MPRKLCKRINKRLGSSYIRKRVIYNSFIIHVSFNLKIPQKEDFLKKNGVLFKKTPKNRTFEKAEVEWGCIQADTVFRSVIPRKFFFIFLGKSII